MSQSPNLKELIANYRKATIEEVLASRGNDCLNEMRCEQRREEAEKALEDYLTNK